MKMKPLEVHLTKAERQAVLRATLSVGWGVQKSQALLSAERKLHEAIRAYEAVQDRSFYAPTRVLRTLAIGSRLP